MLIFLNGLILGLSLIMALGPQNIFLIKQGAHRNHATLSALICFSCDTLLVLASVAGLHELLLAYPVAQAIMIWLGAAFLLYYALKTLHSGLISPTKNAAPKSANKYTRLQIILLALGFSLLNPHAIIDTLVIIGSGSSQFPEHELVFIAGVITASFLWFGSLVLTTRYFASVIARDKVWQAIELLSGSIMAFIGIKLALSGIN